MYHILSLTRDYTLISFDVIYEYEKMGCKRVARGSVFSNWGYTFKYEIQEWMGDKDIIPDSMPNTSERKFLIDVPQDMVL